MGEQGGDRRGDLRGVGGQRGNHPEEGLGKAEPLPDPFQAGDQQPAGGQAQAGREQEERNAHQDRHRDPPRTTSCRPDFPALRG